MRSISRADYLSEACGSLPDFEQICLRPLPSVGLQPSLCLNWLSIAPVAWQLSHTYVIRALSSTTVGVL